MSSTMSLPGIKASLTGYQGLNGCTGESPAGLAGPAGPGITVLPISTAWWIIRNGFTIGAGEIHTVVRLDLVLSRSDAHSSMNSVIHARPHAYNDMSSSSHSDYD